MTTDLEYTNEITDFLDNNLQMVHKETKNLIGFANYILAGNYEKKNHTFPIRYPGATRGYIKTNKENLITDIKIYTDKNLETINCYKKSLVEMNELIQKFKGTTLILEKRYK